jgi:hypothetical protein
MKKKSSGMIVRVNIEEERDNEEKLEYLYLLRCDELRRYVWIQYVR